MLRDASEIELNFELKETVGGFDPELNNDPNKYAKLIKRMRWGGGVNIGLQVRGRNLLTKEC